MNDLFKSIIAFTVIGWILGGLIAPHVPMPWDAFRLQDAAAVLGAVGGLILGIQAWRDSRAAQARLETKVLAQVAEPVAHEKPLSRTTLAINENDGITLRTPNPAVRVALSLERNDQSGAYTLTIVTVDNRTIKDTTTLAFPMRPRAEPA